VSPLRSARAGCSTGYGGHAQRPRTRRPTRGVGGDHDLRRLVLQLAKFALLLTHTTSYDHERGLAPATSEPDAGSDTRPAAGLTRREREVAVLVARGLSNREIAEQLVITEKTAKNHVQHVLDKLAVSSRAKIIARAAELGLTGP
jgi:DNA-binding NarL/FixJ family response regulator